MKETPWFNRHSIRFRCSAAFLLSDMLKECLKVEMVEDNIGLPNVFKYYNNVNGGII